MNFLAHTEISPFEASPWHYLGCIFPDLAKRAGVNFRSKQFLELEMQLPEDFSKGIALHFEADRLFHNSRLFESGLQIWKSLLRPESADLKRTFFLHHLVFEMWLDRLIMKENQQSGLRFYDVLGGLDSDALQAVFFPAFGSESEKLVSVFQQFMKRKFVLAYTEDSRFAEISTGVFCFITRQKQGLIRPSEIEEALERAIPYEAAAGSEWRDFKSFIRP
jgi:hypothetical protein